MTAVSLLPPGADPFLIALSEAFAPASDLPIDGFDQLWDPSRAPAAVLPALARAVGVVLWRADWPTAKKRQVIAQTIALKRKRGTHEAFATYLKMVDVDLVGLRAPPQTLYPRARKTTLERQAWARQFPELRVYPFRRRHTPFGVLTAGKPWGRSGRCARASVAAQYAGVRAELLVEGRAEPVAVRRLADPDGGKARLRIGLTTAGQRMTAGRITGRMVARASSAADRVFTYRAAARGPAALPPSSSAVDYVPIRTSEPVVLPGVVTVGRPVGASRRFLRPSTAADRVFDSVRLHDPVRGRAGDVLPYGGWFAGSGQLGQDRFTLHLDVDAQRTLRGRRPFPFSPTGPLRAHDGRRNADARAAASAAKLGRDQVLVRTSIYRPIAPGDFVPLDGTHRPGQIVRSL